MKNLIVYFKTKAISIAKKKSKKKITTSNRNLINMLTIFNINDYDRILLFDFN